MRRWMGISPRKREGSTEEQRRAIEVEVMAALRDESRVKELRSRLGSLSWFMKSMNEFIARRSNREDEVTGRFWEGRFKCQHLLDDAAILTCMTYVDLNPVRAKLADSLEDSEFTSAYDRIQSYMAKKRIDKLPESLQLSVKEQVKKGAEAADTVLDSLWLADFDGSESPVYGLTERAYLDLVDITGRAIRAGKRGVISPDVVPLLESLEIDADAWVKNVQRYGKLFYRVAGKIEEVVKAAKERGMHWMRGKGGSQQLYKPKIQPS